MATGFNYQAALDRAVAPMYEFGRRRREDQLYARERADRIGDEARADEREMRRLEAIRAMNRADLRESRDYNLTEEKRKRREDVLARAAKYQLFPPDAMSLEDIEAQIALAIESQGEKKQAEDLKADLQRWNSAVPKDATVAELRQAWGKAKQDQDRKESAGSTYSRLAAEAIGQGATRKEGESDEALVGRVGRERVEGDYNYFQGELKSLTERRGKILEDAQKNITASPEQKRVAIEAVIAENSGLLKPAQIAALRSGNITPEQVAKDIAGDYLIREGAAKQKSEAFYNAYLSKLNPLVDDSKRAAIAGFASELRQIDDSIETTRREFNRFVATNKGVIPATPASSAATVTTPLPPTAENFDEAIKGFGPMPAPANTPSASPPAITPRVPPKAPPIGALPSRPYTGFGASPTAESVRQSDLVNSVSATFSRIPRDGMGPRQSFTGNYDPNEALSYIAQQRRMGRDNPQFAAVEDQFRNVYQRNPIQDRQAVQRRVAENMVTNTLGTSDPAVLQKAKELFIAETRPDPAQADAIVESLVSAALKGDAEALNRVRGYITRAMQPAPMSIGQSGW